jgi:regulator of sigma E protease
MAINLLRDVVAGALVLGILVLFHEGGHFVAAKLCKVRVEVFSIGFGKRLWGWKSGDTDYRVSALPLGGYVRMSGDNPAEELTGADYEFLSKPRWQRFLIAIAGPAANILVTLAILWGIYTFKGVPYLPATIATVQPGSPAERAGVKPGDTVLTADGAPIQSWPDLVDKIRGSQGQSLHLMVRRDAQQLAIEVTPKQTKDQDGQAAWMIGASRATKESFQRESIFAAAKDAVVGTASGTKQIVGVIGGLFSGRVSVHDLAGPVGIVQLSGEAAKTGPMTLLELTAAISLNLGLLNLLPIPILDGGHVLMLAVEGLLRRDLSLSFKERFVQVGLVFLLGIFAFVMYSDILRVVQNHAIH